MLSQQETLKKKCLQRKKVWFTFLTASKAGPMFLILEDT